MPVTKSSNQGDVYQGVSEVSQGLKDAQAIEAGTFNSTCLKSYSYNHLTQELTVTFKDGAVHTYTGILKTTFETLKTASSVGRFFNRAIRIG